jgi:geranylgeranyl diphosphate synthase, type I
MSHGELSSFLGHWLPQIEDEMRTVLDVGDDMVATHYGMMRYHMGWANAQLETEPSPTGKRLRPILCLLACAEVGGDPIQALPAAAALEILHNFSLIHDDVEDHDEMRHHRPTVWKLWGVPQAINVGDGMYTLAYVAMLRLARRGVADSVTLAALNRFTQTCLALTEGQHLDIAFESRAQVTVDEYLRMIQGKTAALVSAALAIGARIGSATSAQETALFQFGQAVGLAFQIQDDLLGIWGDPARTGKPAGNDILRKKKSLPLLHALNHPEYGEGVRTLLAAPLRESDLPQAMDLLERAGARAYAEAQMQAQHRIAQDALHAALGDRYRQSPLWALAESLLYREA